jgi:putative ABC transport system permease protein
MSMLLGFRHILRTAFHRAAADAETREELAYHLERQTEKHIAAGMTLDAARRTALLELGGVGRWREQTADTRRGRVLEDLLADTRYAVRGLRARLGFTVSALSTLAIGMGATTAVFSVADGALRRPLPFPSPSRIMSISLRMPLRASGKMVDMTWSYPKFVLLHDRQSVFSSLALYSSETLVLTGDDGAERVSAETASAAYFDILGKRAAIGRTYTADEDRIGGPSAVVVLSDRMWRTRFGASANVIGRTLTIGGVKHSIVGVMPPGFEGLSGDAAFWVPIPAARSAQGLQQPGAHNLQLIGRLANGVTASTARQVVATLGQQIDEAFPDEDAHWGADAYSLPDLRVNATIRRSVELLGVAVVMLLVIVCVNLTTLLVTRGAARRQELAIRLALGGSRRRLVRQLVTESMVLAVLGTVAGVVLGILATRVLAASLPLSMPTASVGTDLTRLTFSTIHFDARALAFVVVLTAAIGAGIGVIAALRIASGSLIASLRQGTASASSVHSRSAMGSTLVIVQVALALAFLAGSALTIQSLRHTFAIPLGYEPADLLAVKMTLDPTRARRESTVALWDAVQNEIRSIPGVRTVALGSCAPIGMHCDGTSITVAGHPGAVHVMFLQASPGYFAALKTHVIRGREFERGDSANTDRVMIINRAAAQIAWGSDDPLLTPVRNGDENVSILGVVDDARYADLEAPAAPAVFIPFRGARGVLFIRADGAPGSLIPAVRRAIRRAGSGHAIGDMRMMSDRLRDATVRNRLIAQVFTAFAVSALLLAAIGVYGTLALRVTQRSREFAIRRALGASAQSLVRTMLAHAAMISVVGLSAGLGLALLLNRTLAALLYDVRTLEPSAYLVSAGVLGVAVLAAAAAPTARSVRIDPCDAMRAE